MMPLTLTSNTVCNATRNIYQNTCKTIHLKLHFISRTSLRKCKLRYTEFLYHNTKITLKCQFSSEGSIDSAHSPSIFNAGLFAEIDRMILK